MTEQSTLRRRIIPLTLFPLFGLCAVLIFSALLISLRLEKTVTDLIEQRSKLLATQVVEVAEGGLRFGISIEDQTALTKKLELLLSNDKQLLKIRVFDDQGKPLLTSALNKKTSDLSSPRLRKALAHDQTKSTDQYVKTWKEKGEQHVLMQSRDAMGLPGASIWVVYSTQSAHVAFEQTLDRLLTTCMWLILAGTLIFSLFVAMIWYPWERHVKAYQSSSGAELSTLTDSPIPGVSLATVIKEISSVEQELQTLEHNLRGSKP